MIRRWRCNNTELFVNENRVSSPEIFVNLAVRLTRVARFAVSPPGLLRTSDPASLEEPARPQVLPFGTSRVQERQEADFESEGRARQACTAHCHHLVCQLIATHRRTLCNIEDLQVLLVCPLLGMLHPRRYRR